MDVAIRKLSEKNRTLMIYMLNTAYCIMKEELPYTLLFYSMNVDCIVLHYMHIEHCRCFGEEKCERMPSIL
jgi:hypothetical protein